jgi:quercetin dioxygenase-like cupin family protein
MSRRAYNQIQLGEAMMILRRLLAVLLFLPAGAMTAAAQSQTAVKATELLKATTTITGQKLAYPKNPQVTATLVEIAPGTEVGWHEHPNIRYVYVIDGTLTIELENGTRHDFPAGTIFIEAVGTRHHGMNAGSAPAKVLFIDHSEEGQSNFVRAEPPESYREGQSSREQPKP